MSSKTQLNEYNKNLKRQLSELKRENRKLLLSVKHLKRAVNILNDDLQKSRLRERKWYHFF